MHLQSQNVCNNYFAAIIAHFVVVYHLKIEICSCICSCSLRLVFKNHQNEIVFMDVCVLMCVLALNTIEGDGVDLTIDTILLLLWKSFVLLYV